MAIPPLRQPKGLAVQKKPTLIPKTTLQKNDFVIVTMKNDFKLVVSSDAYHGIIPSNGSYNCVFCDITIDLNYRDKEVHKLNPNHKDAMLNYPHIEELSENLIRKVSMESFYCTICNVIFSNNYLNGHLNSELHNQELERAIARAKFYQPAN